MCSPELFDMSSSGDLFSHLCQRAAVIVIADLHGHSNGGLLRNIRRRRRLRRFSVAVQPLCLDHCRIILVADIQIHITGDTVNLALFAVLPDANRTVIAELIAPFSRSTERYLSISMPLWLV